MCIAGGGMGYLVCCYNSVKEVVVLTWGGRKKVNKHCDGHLQEEKGESSFSGFKLI